MFALVKEAILLSINFVSFFSNLIINTKCKYELNVKWNKEKLNNYKIVKS